MSSKILKILIYGITGQDGSYLAELCLEKGHQVFGVIRRSSSSNTKRIDHIKDKCTLITGDITDPLNVLHIIQQVQPDQIYNLAAMSHVGLSFDLERFTTEVDGLGPLHILNAIRQLKLETRYYQASTSEMFGNSMNEHSIQKLTIDSPMNPCSPYAISKLYAHLMVKHYRKAYKIFAISSLVFNHESSRRGDHFVTQKVVKWACGYFQKDKKVPLQIGSLDATRDWGHAKDYVRGIFDALQIDEPVDFVLATGQQTSVRKFIELVCQRFDINIVWEGSGINEKGFDQNHNLLVQVNPEFYRPNELTDLCGEASLPGWKPEFTLDMIIDEMIENINDY